MTQSAIEPLARLREQFRTCLRSSCEKGGCALKLDNISRDSVVVIDCDSYSNERRYSGKIPDCLVFYSDSELVAAVVEMKGGQMDANVAVDQIAAGANLVNELLAGDTVGSFLPILLHAKGLHSTEIKILRGRKVEFRGRRRLVILKRCGELFKKILDEHRPSYSLQ